MKKYLVLNEQTNKLETLTEEQYQYLVKKGAKKPTNTSNDLSYTLTKEQEEKSNEVLKEVKAKKANRKKK